jgi:hypothetical protein
MAQTSRNPANTDVAFIRDRLFPKKGSHGPWYAKALISARYSSHTAGRGAQN